MWDVDAQGVPHPLGVLSHFDAVVWETGDDRLIQDPEDGLTDTFLFGPVPDIAVAERQQYLTLALRDYLNEGGKLVQAGENTQYFGLLGRSLGGIHYGSPGRPIRTASSPATSSPTACCCRTTSLSTTSARPTGPEWAGRGTERSSLRDGGAGSRAKAWELRRSMSARVG